ncbi:GntP family permease [Caldisalinibacter kiritimatiensis]|uniref:D-beta-hydroxybutyrate permease n=1 Tax=Caldisalinibacter kiritimatiensis TaxID=1304284 RepID=R1CMT1_9FIRM|nr:GntP family permease [Caldisalinibacter kiritimatiensis]EOC99985.1 D-beta-hydroxybutyrate permease [Caldisalinibacter kiritimatiensis]
MLGVIAIILTLAGLMYFAYRGVTVLVLAPILAMIAVLVSGELPPLHALSEVFMPAATSYISKYFPVFLAGAIFGKLMGVTGAATAIADFIAEKFGEKRAITAVVVATALLTYGGVSLFVVVFAMYPIGATLFRRANVPKRLLPGAIALGAFTFTMTALPGSPQYLNTMPTVYFGTDIYAAPVLGILAAAIMFFGGNYYLNYRAKKLMENGEGYGDHPNENLHELDDNIPSFGLAITPILIVFVINTVLTKWYFKMPSVVEKYEAAGGAVNGTWPVILGLGIAVVFILITMRKFIPNSNKTVFDGAVGALLPIFNTASEVGYGGVIKSLAAFTTVKMGIVSLGIPSVFKVGISTTLLAGIVGSSSGGTAIALDVLSKEFLSMGLAPEALHRIMLVAAGGLDSLPHCGAVITLLAVCQLTHKESYKDIAFNTIVLPIAASFFISLFYLVTGIY